MRHTWNTVILTYIYEALTFFLLVEVNHYDISDKLVISEVRKKAS